MELTPLFIDAEAPGDDLAVVQRWAANYETDLDDSDKNDFREVVARRPTVKAMNFSDYDHDGRASEFFLQTNVLPCGKPYGVVIGVSKSNPKLHVLGSADQPDQPLVLPRFIWEAFSSARGSIEKVAWICDDHAAEEETTISLRNTSKGIRAVQRTFSCPRFPGQRPTKEDRF